MSLASRNYIIGATPVRRAFAEILGSDAERKTARVEDAFSAHKREQPAELGASIQVRQAWERR